MSHQVTAGLSIGKIAAKAVASFPTCATSAMGRSHTASYHAGKHVNNRTNLGLITTNAVSGTRDTSKITTPVRHSRLLYYLNGYEAHAKKYLVDGFRHGFRINFMGCPPKQHRYNLKSANIQPDTVNQKLSGEIAATRIAGPFQEPSHLTLGTCAQEGPKYISSDTSFVLPSWSICK
jgi:hypothetical protein